MLLSLFLACRISSQDFVRPETVPLVDIPPATPPPAAGPGGEKLFQLLYAGEVGDDVHPLGQRVRILAWLSAANITPRHVDDLQGLSARVREIVAEDRRALGAVGAAEREQLAPIYEELARRLASREAISDEEYAAVAVRLAAARAAVEAGADPRVTQRSRVKALLGAVEDFVVKLDMPVHARLGQSRFFLARRAHPLLNPVEYGELVGMVWDGGDFSAVDATATPATQEQMDLGGLWSLEGLRAPPGGYMTRLQVQAVLVMALLEPGFPGALEAWRGERDPLDLSLQGE